MRKEFLTKIFKLTHVELSKIENLKPEQNLDNLLTEILRHVEKSYNNEMLWLSRKLRRLHLADSVLVFILKEI